MDIDLPQQLQRVEDGSHVWNWLPERFGDMLAQDLNPVGRT
jgi:hypothetical protein